MSQIKAPLRVAIIGTARRSDYLYGPILAALPDKVQLVSVWGRSPDSARRLGESLGAPWFTDLDKLVRETAPQVGIVSVNYNANGQVGLMAVQAGLHVLLETPIAHKLSEADAIIAEAARRGLKVEVAEQFHRRPLEQIKLKLIDAGIFGRVYSSFNDFAGHGYHGVSVMRSYLGFGARPIQVTGAVRKYDLAEHWSRLSNTTTARSETQEHAIVEFEGGQVGIFHWTDVGYDSPLRWWRSSRFLAERGMGITVGVGLDVEERLSTLSSDGEAAQFIALERRWERVDGGALEAMVAHTSNPERPTVTWQNPFRPVRQGHGPQWHDDEIGVAGCLLSLVDAVQSDTQPTYGAQQARLDQEIILAIRQSSQQGGQPVKLPLDPANLFVGGAFSGRVDIDKYS
ncbi:MAG: Gfo/Idh/MocA family oxidoreductase [Chloroflexi bacterium]|nr:Gfo/Idh/MocA family oxidoreductase [Chloroflexota bacterium]MCL5275191.1 Gfo/Idh/MocA family oxidoreductase [Chloroflexota bacterium]